MGSPNSSFPYSDKGVGDPGREMGGDGGLGDSRPGSNEVLDVAGSTVFPRGDPRRNDWASVWVSPMSLPEHEADCGWGARSFPFLVTGDAYVGARGSDGIRPMGTSCRRMATTLSRRADGLLSSPWSPDMKTSKFSSWKYRP